MKNTRSLVLTLLFVACFAGCPAKKDSAPAPGGVATPSESGAKAPEAVAPSFATPDAAVKGFFDAVNEKKYGVAWASLTPKSQQKIVDMVSQDEKMKPEEVKALFDQNKTPIQRGFWDSFRESSKTSQFAPAATYKTLNENGNQASVELSSGNVKLEIKAFKEGNGWKAGYIETFME